MISIETHRIKSFYQNRLGGDRIFRSLLWLLRKNNHKYLPSTEYLRYTSINYLFLVFILFENLFKPRQLPSATSKQCFEQHAASFLVCPLLFIEYKNIKEGI